MKVRLRILHGKLQDKAGHDTSLDVKIRGPRFVIGSADDCSMCCRSRSVAAYHCEILLEPRGAVLRPLCQDNPSLVNGESVGQERLLKSGDILRLGRLEFQVVIEQAAEVSPASANSAGGAAAELLVAADERERAFRREHPELRYLHLESVQEKPADQQPPAEEPPSGKPKRKKGKLPGKLPPPPPRITEDSEEAAEEALRKLFGPKHRRPGG